MLWTLVYPASSMGQSPKCSSIFSAILEEQDPRVRQLEQSLTDRYGSTSDEQWYEAPRTLKQILQFENGPQRLRPVFETLIRQLGNDQFPLGNLKRSIAYEEMIHLFCAHPAFKAEVPKILRAVLEAHRRPKNQFLSGEHALAQNLRFLDDVALKIEIQEYFISNYPNLDDRGGLHFLLGQNPDLFRFLPVALGIGRDLAALSALAKGVNYKDWQEFRWVPDSKSILPFKGAFHHVVNEAGSVHFEIGPFLQDLPGLKENLKKIAARGDEQILRELKEVYDRQSEPHFRADEFSMTLLEVYWIVMNPGFVHKTVFYSGLRRLSPQEVTAFLTALRL